MNRRELLKTLAGATAALMLPLRGEEKPGIVRDRWGDLLPRRKLGESGESVTMLGVGGYHIGWTSDRDAQAVIEAAMAGGVRFFDTAESYGPGTSEERYGNYLTPQYRDDIFLMTKTHAKTAQQAREHLEGSLRRMKTERIDLWQVHSLGMPEDVDERLRAGVMEEMLKAKAEGKVRHLGFTGHANPAAHLRMLGQTRDNNPFTACQLPVNPVDAADDHSFIRQVLPGLLERGIAPLAMKTLADGRFFAEKNQHKWRTENPVVPNRLSMEDAIHFAWSLPVSVLITGAENEQFLEEKIRLARNFIRLSEARRNQLVEAVVNDAEAGRVEYYKMDNRG